MTDQNRAYFDRLLFWQRRTVGKGQFTLKIIPAAQLGAASNEIVHSEYPVAPEFMARLNFSEGGSTRSLDVFFAPDQGVQREVLACPDPDLAAQMADREQRDAAHAGNVRERIAQISPELKRRIRSLLAEGKKIDAITLYAKEASADIGTAKDVVERLGGEGL